MNYCTAVLVLLASNIPMKSGCVNSYSANANNKVSSVLLDNRVL